MSSRPSPIVQNEHVVRPAVHVAFFHDDSSRRVTNQRGETRGVAGGRRLSLTSRDGGAGGRSNDGRVGRENVHVPRVAWVTVVRCETLQTCRLNRVLPPLMLCFPHFRKKVASQGFVGLEHAAVTWSGGGGVGGGSDHATKPITVA